MARVLFRKRKVYRFTQADLGRRIGVSGSYISSLESGRVSPRLAELEDLATHFRTTAFELLAEAAEPDAGYIPATEQPAPKDDLDGIAENLSAEHRDLAREFLLFLRERDRVDGAETTTP